MLEVRLRRIMLACSPIGSRWACAARGMQGFSHVAHLPDGVAMEPRRASEDGAIVGMFPLSRAALRRVDATAESGRTDEGRQVARERQTRVAGNVNGVNGEARRSGRRFRQSQPQAGEAREAGACEQGRAAGRSACWVGPCEIRTAAPLAKEAIAMQQPTGHSARGLCLRGACLITRWRGQMAWTALDGRDGTLDCAGWTRRNMDCALGRAARRASRLLGTGGEEEEEGEQPGFASTPCTWAAPALVAAGSWTLARGSWLPQAELAR